MPRELLPTHCWYRCDVCGEPQQKGRITPKAIADGTVKCGGTPKCGGRMRGPVPNPFPEHPSLDEAESARWATAMSELRKRAKRAEKAMQKLREEQGGAVLHLHTGPHVLHVSPPTHANVVSLGAAAGDVRDLGA